MSLIHLPRRALWASFLAAFPKPGSWTKPCRRQLRLDDNGFSLELVPIYRAVRTRLSPDTVRGVDLLVSAIAVHGLPKKSGFDTSSVYTPHCAYRKADFAGGDTDSPIPRSCPEQVAMILDAMNAADLASLTAAVKTEWARLESDLYYFESAQEYTNHLKNWARVLEEVRQHGDGLAIELV